MIDLRARILEFAAWHRHPGNRACHAFGIPAVTLATLGALSRVELPLTLPVVGVLDLALVLLAGTWLFDLAVGWRLAPLVLAGGLASWWIARPLPAWALGLVFLAGWTAQLVGHRVFEGNAPAFTTNLVHLIVGPRWLVNRVLRVYPER